MRVGGPGKGDAHARRDRRFLERHQLARQKLPERLELVSEFPTTPSGKVQKYKLRDLIVQRMERPA